MDIKNGKWIKVKLLILLRNNINIPKSIMIKQMKDNNLKISIITPSYNSGNFIERAIKSVITQDYKNFEHIIIDGGSTDNTIGILETYKHLRWISESDNGQSDAMNKGFEKSTGDIIVYLNADDYFLPNAFSSVIEEFKKGAKFVIGNVLVKSPRLKCEFINVPRITLEGMLRHWEPNAYSHNPVGYFYSREVQEMCPFNKDNYATMDLEFLLDTASKFEFTRINKTLGCFEDGIDTKTGKTQLRLDYWCPSNFPYIDKYLWIFNEEQKVKFMDDRRNGYVIMQSYMNKINQNYMELIPAKDIPLISIIIPTFNCSQYLCKAVDSVLSQELENFEIIIIDDASTDNTQEIFEKNYKKNSKIKMIIHQENKMLGAARNNGISVAKGKYIFFLDSDDWMEKGALIHLASIAEQYNADIVDCGIQKVFENGKIKPYHANAFSCNGGIEALYHFADYRIASIVWNKLFSLDFINKNKLSFISSYWFEDVMFTINAIYKCKKYISIDNIYMNYFQRSSSYSNSRPTLLNLESNINIYIEIINFIKRIDLCKDEAGRDLCARLLRSHCSNDVFPKMLRYVKSYSNEEWEGQCRSICYERLGVEGYAIADLLIYSLNNIKTDAHSQYIMEHNIFNKIKFIVSHPKIAIYKFLHKIYTKLIMSKSLVKLYKKSPEFVKKAFYYLKLKIK